MNSMTHSSNFQPHVDTITALATPPGQGGIAIIRISGPAVKRIIQELVGRELLPRLATYLVFREHDGQAIDEGLAIFFPHPNSFTGEDVVELHGHGGPVVADLLLQRILQLGTRLARPGEFSERAFLNGKMDLAQAEAIADLIQASSQQAARSAIRSLQGEFSKEINVLNEKIIHLRMYVEAAIDFTDEEIDFLQDEKIILGMQSILDDLKSIQKKAKQGSFLREGIRVVIAGRPNVGKSSLLNCLSGKETAIVTNIPGTTRDVLRDSILIDGMPIHIIDTAGLRSSDDIVEQEGIRRAYEEMQQADVVLYVVDANESSAITTQDLPAVLSSRPLLFIRNKIDLINDLPTINQQEGHHIISLSAKLGLGIDLLKQAIKSQVGFQSGTEGLYLARRRHLDALTQAQTHVEESLKQLSGSRSGELAAEDLRLAQRALGDITGTFTADELLGRIFSSFCIGK